MVPVDANFRYDRSTARQSAIGLVSGAGSHMGLVNLTKWKNTPCTRIESVAGVGAVVASDRMRGCCVTIG